MPASLPRDFPGLRQLLLERMAGLPKRLAQVAEFSMSHPNEIAFGTAASIAEQVAVQPSTLVRFAQALGYEGFSELQTIFRDRLRDRLPSYQERIEALRSHTGADAKAGALVDGFADAAERSIRHLRERLVPAELDRAAAILAKADTVYLIGQRRSFPITSYMNYAFGKLGVKSILVGSANGTDNDALSFATARDAAIAVSFTPYTPTTVAHAAGLSERGIPTVAITDSPFSPLVRDSGVWFEVAEADFEGFRSLSATMALAMMLTVAVAETRR